MPQRPRTEIDFWRNVNKREPHECWEWMRSCTRDGYGQTTFLGARWASHRLAYHLANGEIGDGHVLHKCDNTKCCNPDHLYLGDNKQNANDRIIRNRSARGERHGNAVLTDETVASIRKRARAGEPLKQIADSLNLATSTVGNAAHNYWLHVSEPPLPKRKRSNVTSEIRQAILRDWLASRDSQEAIAGKYGIHQTTVSAIVRNREEATA